MIKERVDKLICNWSLMNSHSFTESELNSLVDLIGDECENENLALKVLAEAGNLKIAKLQAAVKDASIVLEGSIAYEGQSEEILDQREEALVRFLEARQALVSEEGK